jgi:hypothetical protein
MPVLRFSHCVHVAPGMSAPSASSVSTRHVASRKSCASACHITAAGAEHFVHPTQTTAHLQTEQPSPPSSNDDFVTLIKPGTELSRAQLRSIVMLASTTAAVYLEGECACYFSAAEASKCTTCGFQGHLGMYSSHYVPTACLCRCATQWTSVQQLT